ncbi:MAG: cobalt ECF transporter T component CbiQ [Candidatus Thermoplasmatota archaeon]|nr:cobalt ECF transporter T component CbiQ [Euryarchaeota archaeon]MBU4071306.1 cobalt ECF transporter T component CbiQ [Candidatus Thermoplasmatota archaeon]MBU4143399.1 cobalt ECF transporter T component CbiQ [Candidatus Thermoplasmatota archaeon]MBU4592210.1 cobalt ECF transporter T component CbiQ [Candidatus Thermoplasmatota archaeon]
MHESPDCRPGNYTPFDPRTKIVGVAFFVVAVALLTENILLLFSVVFMLCLLVISGVSGTRIGKRYAIALPFILLASVSMYLTSGQDRAMGMFLRISASVLALVLLSVTTAFHDLLNGLQRLRVPGLVVNMLMFTYRYIFVLTEEMGRMNVARRARGYRGGGSLLNRHIMGTISNTAGMLLVRAYERGLRVHDSLTARGYDGRIRTLSRQNLQARDAAFCGSLVFMGLFLISAELGMLA